MRERASGYNLEHFPEEVHVVAMFGTLVACRSTSPPFPPSSFLQEPRYCELLREWADVDGRLLTPFVRRTFVDMHGSARQASLCSE